MLVARFHGGHRIDGVLAFSTHDRRERAVGALPAAVAIHRVVAAADRGDPSHGKLREIARRRRGRDVTPVGERMDPRALGHALDLGHREERTEVVDVGVNAAVGDEPEEMQVAATLARASERREQRLVPRERAVLDRAIHPREILEQDPARPDREVADLRVPHLPGRKAHRLARRRECRVRVPLPESVEHRRAGELDGVPWPRRRNPPAVEDDEADGLQATSAAARQIASNDVTSSDAPPTSAPSTAGCPRSTAALSGFTEPP